MRMPHSIASVIDTLNRSACLESGLEPTSPDTKTLNGRFKHPKRMWMFRAHSSIDGKLSCTKKRIQGRFRKSRLPREHPNDEKAVRSESGAKSGSIAQNRSTNMRRSPLPNRWRLLNG